MQKIWSETIPELHVNGVVKADRQLIDRHLKQSVGSLKPDDIMYSITNGNAFAVQNEYQILCVGELKGMKRAPHSFSPSQKDQIVGYLIDILNYQVPRNFIYGYLMNLKVITFFRVSRVDRTELFSVREEGTVPLVTEGWKKLMTLYSMDKVLLGYSFPTIRIDNVSYDAADFLGAG